MLYRYIFILKIFFISICWLQSTASILQEFTDCNMPDTEKRQGKWNPSILADFCWTFKRDVYEAKKSRTSYTFTF